MGDESGKTFDLIILLKMGDVDIQRVIRNNLSQRVGDYINLLTRFESDSLKTMDSLNKISTLEGDESDLQNLADITELLEAIGCTKIIPAVDEIIKAGKRGHAKFAADCAKKTLDDFNKLQARVMAAKKAGKSETAADENFWKKTLKEAVPLLEQEEAVRKLRVLAVDDAPVMIKTISGVLSDEYKVHGLTNPTLLEKFLDQIVPDLFLLDYEMPEINGFELIPIIRNFEEHKETPIIFLTSMGTMEHVSAAAALGARDFIVKPFQGDNLKDKVAKHIARKKLVI